MNIELITELPSWLLIACIAFGAGVSALLYFRDKTFEGLSPWLKRILAVSRFIFITLIAVFLLSPLIKTVIREVEKPLLIFAQDNSRSVVQTKDSAFYKNDYQQVLQNFLKEKSTEFDVRYYTFGENVNYSEGNATANFSEKQTDISSLFESVYTNYSNRNIGAVVIATDGLFNKGSNPLYAASFLKAPVFTVAMGDTTVHKDLMISKVSHNRIAYLGNIFPVEVGIDARKCKGSQANLTVLKDSTVVLKKTIDIPSQTFHMEVPLTLEAKVKGINHFRIQLSELDGEISYSNNSRDIYVEILESRQRILIMAHAPHPDIAALKSVLEKSSNYELTFFYANDPKPGTVVPSNFANYNLVISHQLPVKDASLISKAKQSGTPILFITGGQTSVAQFNSLQAGLNIKQNLAKFNEVTPWVSGEFVLFTFPDELLKRVSRFSPLLAPFGDYSMSGNSGALFNQQIGLVKSRAPLISFVLQGESKYGFISGEGIWKWKLREFAEFGNSDAFDEIISKTTQYLVAKEDKRPFRVVAKTSFLENEQVQFEATLMNESNERINVPEVKLTITSADKKTFPFTFSRTEKAYSLNAGYFPPGRYHYNASVVLGDKSLNSSGAFSINPLQVEATETVADYPLLYSIAQKYGGELFSVHEFEKLSSVISSRDDIKPVSYFQKRLKELINIRWLFFLILTFIALEWVLRKRMGGY